MQLRDLFLKYNDLDEYILLLNLYQILENNKNMIYATHDKEIIKYFTEIQIKIYKKLDKILDTEV